MGKLTRLDGVNRIIRPAGEYPVVSLSNDGVNDTSIAEQVLDETNVVCQLEGQHCNTETSQFNFDNDGFIRFSDDTIFVRAVGCDINRNVCVRGVAGDMKLYDLDNRTYVFDEQIELKVITGIPFEELPTDMQYWVVDTAAAVYQHTTVGDKDMTQLLLSISNDTRRLARANDIRAKHRNMSQGVNGKAIKNRWFGYRLGG